MLIGDLLSEVDALVVDRSSPSMVHLLGFAERLLIDKITKNSRVQSILVGLFYFSRHLFLRQAIKLAANGKNQCSLDGSQTRVQSIWKESNDAIIFELNLLASSRVSVQVTDKVYMALWLKMVRKKARHV